MHMNVNWIKWGAVLATLALFSSALPAASNVATDAAQLTYSAFPTESSDPRDGQTAVAATHKLAQQLASGIAHNVAAGKPARQSSTYFAASADRAVDGIIDGDFTRGSTTHTALESRPWWRVDLGQAHKITRVVLWNRTDCCAERLSDFTVKLWDKSSSLVASTVFPGVAGRQTEIPISGSDVYAVTVQLNQTGHLSLAEVQVFGYSNLAQFAPSSQSSTDFAGVSSRATDGSHSGGSFVATHTKNENRPWLQIELASPSVVDSVLLWNRSDCCLERLSNFTVTYYNEDGHDLATANYAGTAGLKTPINLSAAGVSYVRVQLNGTGILSLDEVQVYGLSNLALGKPAAQSTTFVDGPIQYHANRAVDGSSNGNLYAASTTHTQLENNPWWEVRLGAQHAVSMVRVWNRTDCCSDRLKNFLVIYSDLYGTELMRASVNGGTQQIDVPLAVQNVARIRVQLTQPNYLSLSEVQVFPALPTNDGFDTASSIPLRDYTGSNDFAMNLGGGALKVSGPYPILFDTGSWNTHIPYGALNKAGLTVLQSNVITEWGKLADKVQGQLAARSRDGQTMYTIDNYIFFALKNPDGSDMADTGGSWPAIMGGFPTAPSFAHALALKYGTFGVALGMLTDTPSKAMKDGWASFNTYLKIGADPAIENRLFWKSYVSGTEWYPTQPNFDPIVVPGFDVSFQFPAQSGVRPADLTMTNRIATFDTGAGDLVLRTYAGDPHRAPPYDKYFTTDGARPWYPIDQALQTKLGVSMTIKFKTDSKTCAYSYSTATASDSRVPDKVTVGNWGSDIPWRDAVYLPRTRFNVGNSAFYHFPVIWWAVNSKRVGVFCR
jgi:F5/8 type C domain